MAKICFIVGHGKSAKGGYDSGATNGKYHEFKIAREIAKYAQEYYNKHYSEHADLMNYDGNLYLQERINKCKDDTYSFIAEIHLNAGGGTGTECYYHHGSAKGKKYADKICKNIAEALGVKQRSNGTDDGGDKIKLGSNGTDYFGIIRSTKPCAVLIETVFIDTKADLDKVKTAAGQKKCGEAIAKAVASVRGLKEKSSTASKPATSSANKKPATTKTESKPVVKNEKYSNGAESFNSKYKNGKTYKTTVNLRLRKGAGTDEDIIDVLPKGSKVTWYGYYTVVGKVIWKYVKTASGKVGFVSSEYLK